jgi:hypothetical protein
MAAFDIVGLDFELGLGIDAGFGRKQEGAAGLAGIGALGGGLDMNPPTKYGMSLILDDILVEVATAAVGLLKSKAAVGIADLLTLNPGESFEIGVGAGSLGGDAKVVAGKARACVQRCELIVAIARLDHLGVPDVDPGFPILVLPTGVVEAGSRT